MYRCVYCEEKPVTVVYRCPCGGSHNTCLDCMERWRTDPNDGTGLAMPCRYDLPEEHLAMLALRRIQ